MNKLYETFNGIFFNDRPVKLIFSDKRRKSIEFKKVTIRPIMAKESLAYQAEYTFDKKATHRNISQEDIAEFCYALVTESFKQVNVFTDNFDMQILASKPENPRVTKKPSTLGCCNLAHNRVKNYVIPDGKPCDFLIRLGVMDKSGKVIPKHYAKFRQINRYLEIVEDVFPYLPKHEDKPLKIIDFGCGKAYLTFAIYYYLKILKGRNVEIIGLDLKEDVIDFCNKVAADLDYGELRFLPGDIADYSDDHADMVVTLHACDTATDYALINAVAWNTKVILSVPCCQHELFSQIENDIHAPMLKHGILKDRLTEYLTDGLRALKLEACGYNVALIEFTSLEHTARNIMIKAVKGGSCNSAKSKKAQSQYEALRDFYHVNPTIDKLTRNPSD